MIDQQAPDVLGLQEIGDPDALDDLVARLDGDWPRRTLGRPNSRGIRMAWLTRHPADRPGRHRRLPRPTQARAGRRRRQPPRYHGPRRPGRYRHHRRRRRRPADHHHLKSKLLTYPGDRFFPHNEDEHARYGAYALARRGGEAAALRVALTEALDGHGDHRPVVLTGDLNHIPQAATTQLLYGPPGSELLTPAFDRPDKGDLTRMWYLAPLMPAGRDYSRNNQGRLELIDHILVTRALLDAPKQIAVGAVIDTPMPSVDPTHPNTRRNAPASDHAPSSPSSRWSNPARHHQSPRAWLLVVVDHAELVAGLRAAVPAQADARTNQAFRGRNPGLRHRHGYSPTGSTGLGRRASLGDP